MVNKLIIIIILIILLFFIIIFGKKKINETLSIKFENENESMNFNKKKIAIITSIYGNYDILKKQNINNKNYVDWFCFTDSNILENKGWNIINTPYHMMKFNEYYNSLKKKDLKHYNMMSAKYYKIQPHNIDILQDYYYYIWIDGSIFLQEDFIKNIYEVIHKNEKNDVIHFKHSLRDNIKDEVFVSIEINKYKNIDLFKQYNDYIKDGFTDDIGLYENTIIIRKNKPQINYVFDKWFQENIKYGFQDQISLPFIYWKYNITPHLINENVFNNDLYSYIDLLQNINHYY
jgi:hypothetical protein